MSQHQLVAQQISKMWKTKIIQVQRIAFAVNCISRYADQQGRCAITGQIKLMDEFEGHHIVPQQRGGQDAYENIIFLSKPAHLLIRATDPALVQRLLSQLNLSEKQLKKLNDLRERYGIEIIGA